MALGCEDVGRGAGVVWDVGRVRASARHPPWESPTEPAGYAALTRAKRVDASSKAGAVAAGRAKAERCPTSFPKARRNGQDDPPNPADTCRFRRIGENSNEASPPPASHIHV